MIILINLNSVRTDGFKDSIVGSHGGLTQVEMCAQNLKYCGANWRFTGLRDRLLCIINKMHNSDDEKDNI